MIIADDLTGALDTGAQLAKNGIATAVLRQCVLLLWQQKRYHKIRVRERIVA